MSSSSAPSALRQKQGRELLAQGPWLALTALVILAVILPIVPLQSQALADGGAGLKELLAMPGLGSVLRNTIYLGLGAMVIGMALGTTLALSVYAMPPRLQALLAFTPVLPLVIPSVAHVVGFVFLFSPENGYGNLLLRQIPIFASATTGPVNVYTPLWIIIYTGLHLSAFVYLFVYAGLNNLGADYGQAARVSGAGPIRVLFTVTLPMLRPVFIYSSLVVLLLALGQFTGPLILGRREGLDVLTTRMFVITTDYPINYGLAASLGTPLLIVAFFIIFIQRRMVGDQRRFVGRGAASRDRAPVRKATRIVATTYVLLYVILSAGLPLLALTYVSLSPFWSGQLSLENLSIANFEDTFDDSTILDAISTSLWVTVLGVVIVLPLGFLIALMLTNRDRIWRPLSVLIDIAAALPLAVPAALVGFGFLFAFSIPGIDLYGTRTALVIAYVTIMLPYAVRYQLTTLIALGKQTVEASRVCGGGPLRTFWRIMLPLIRGGVAASAAIMFVLLIHEFGVSLLLRSPDSTVMSVLLFDQFSTGLYPQVAVIAIVMTAITAVGVIAALIFGGTNAMERL